MSDRGVHRYLQIIVIIPLLASYFVQKNANIIAWSLCQWLPITDSLRAKVHQTTWDSWEEDTTHQNNFDGTHLERFPQNAVVDVQAHRHHLSQYLEQTYGTDWRKRPLVLKGLWSQDELKPNNDKKPRKISLEGLLHEDLKIPYFRNARMKLLSPDGFGRVRDVVYNMTMGAPHKIGSQLILEKYPDLIEEVAPLEVVTELFGDYFSPDHIKGSGPWNLFPAITTVPLFVANNHAPLNSSSLEEYGHSNENEIEIQQQPYTALHCEPIGNIAVQLTGQKKWTLVQPEYSSKIKPAISPDGRAFFSSWAKDYKNVPVYETITTAGDGIWVPTWTWHRVDYIESDDIAIAGSLFHFRAVDFVRNNALFAGVMIPALVKELLGFNTQ